MSFVVNLSTVHVLSVIKVIIRYEMSPLVRISSQKKACDGVLNKVIAMLHTRQEHRLKLLE